MDEYKNFGDLHEEIRKVQRQKRKTHIHVYVAQDADSKNGLWIETVILQ